MSKALIAHTLKHARKDPTFAAALRAELLRVAAVKMDADRFWGLVSKIDWPKNEDIAGVLFEEVSSDQELLAFLRTFQSLTEDLLEAVRENISKTPVGEIEDQIELTSFGLPEAAAIVGMGRATCSKCLEGIGPVVSAMNAESFDTGFLPTLESTATISEYLSYRESYNALSEQARGLVEVFKEARGALRTRLGEAQRLLDSSGSQIQAYLTALEAQNTSKVESMRDSGEISQALVDFSLAVDMMSGLSASLAGLQNPLSRQISNMI